MNMLQLFNIRRGFSVKLMKAGWPISRPTIRMSSWKPRDATIT